VNGTTHLVPRAEGVKGEARFDAAAVFRAVTTAVRDETASTLVRPPCRAPPCAGRVAGMIDPTFPGAVEPERERFVESFGVRIRVVEGAIRAGASVLLCHASGPRAGSPRSRQAGVARAIAWRP
jgi:hypothetical protein